MNPARRPRPHASRLVPGGEAGTAQDEEADGAGDAQGECRCQAQQDGDGGGADGAIPAAVSRLMTTTSVAPRPKGRVDTLPASWDRQ